MADTERELKKVRDEAAQRRVELAPYKKAFESFDDDAKDWLLTSIEMINQDPIQAGERFANLAYGNMGDEHFGNWVSGNTAVDTVDNTNNIGDNSNMSDNENEIDVTDWAQALESRIMSALEEREAKTKQMFEQRDKHSQYKDIREKITALGYDPDSWQGRMLVQTATTECSEDKTVAERLQEADTLVRERLNNNIKSEPIAENVQVGNAEIAAPPLETPSTAANIGGAGIANVSEDVPFSFGDANQALNQLLKSEIGQ
tara:strand:+ start:3883 stop:4659 length:777 start_codon:yes stop_codon:yes gene_type:complete